MFEVDYMALNEAQQEVVKTIQQNALVLAPAGTGKTKVIALRSAYLIQQQVPPEELLCLTFTNKAAKEMKERISLYITDQAKRMTVKTFHAFCYTLISSEKQYSHFSFPCTIIDETDSDSILKRILETKGLDDERLYFPEIRSFIENIKRYSLDFPLEERYDYQKVSESYFKENDTGRRLTGSFLIKHGLGLFKTYQKYLKDNNCVDFMDLIVEAKYLLEQEPLKIKWNQKYRYIQVDEMQDTSRREYDIIKILSENNNLVMFGDFNQTIYEWRGSNPTSMTEDFKKDFSPKSITLSVNYRSTRTLLEAANDYIRNSQLYPIQCVPTSVVEGDKISIIEAETKEQEMSLIANLIKTSACKNVVVLTRTNDYAKDISEVFQRENLPCTVIEDTKLFRKKEIKDILAFFDYSINCRNGHALLKICRHPYLNMGHWLIEELRQTKVSYMYLHDWFSAESKDPYASLFAAYAKGNIVVLDVESTGLDVTQDDIIQIAAVRYGKEGISASLDVLVKPTRSVGTSYLVHGFTDELLREKGIDAREALAQLLDFTRETVIVGHNVNYDLQIIRSMLERYGLEALKHLAVYDTLDLAYKVYPRLTNHNLETLAKLLQTSTQPNHNAMQDILATSEVLTHLMGQIAEKKQERLEKLEAFYSYMDEYKKKVLMLSEFILQHTVSESIIYMMNDCDFKQYYSKKEIDSLRMLYKIAEELYDNEASFHDNIIKLLSFSSLHYSEMEQSELFKERIPIITVHQAKGLEFDHVYIAGCNDKVFPLARSLKDHQLSEEKRLFYVGITRARQKLFLSYHQEAKKSIFLDEIGERYKDYKRYSQNM